MSTTQNIVIIGGSIAGHTLANALASTLPTTHRILVVDANDYGYWPVAGLRAGVVPGWEDRVTLPITTPTFFAAGTAHQVIAPNKVVELKSNSIVLEKPFEGSNEVPFFKCIIATGSLQSAPMRAELGTTSEDMKNFLRKMQSDFEKASKVLVIGGGPVGLEVAGEIRDRYPNTEITIVHNQSHVLNPSSNPNSAQKSESWTAPASYPKLSTTLEAELKAMKIDLILGDRAVIPESSETDAGSSAWNGSSGLQDGLKTVKLQSGKSVQADYVFVSIGNKSSAGFVEKVDQGAVAGGMVNVDEYLRVKSSTPDSILAKNYYAIGDVCNTPGWKTSQTAVLDATYAATSILADVKGTKPKKYSRSTMHGLIIPLGKSRGAGSLTLPLIGNIMAPNMVLNMKAKDLFINQSFASLYKGAQKVTVPAIKD